MSILRVFDPALCCSTGICGPSVDPELTRFAADLDWLKSKGVFVERYNLAQQPGAFVEPLVKAALEDAGEEALPLLLADGVEFSRGRYPSRDELSTHFDLSTSCCTPKEEEKSSCCGPKTEEPPKSSGCCGSDSDTSTSTGGGCC